MSCVKQKCVDLTYVKNSASFEKLQVVVNSLESVDEGSMIDFNHESTLNTEKVKCALDELIGGKDGLAYILLDEFAQLFSPKLLDESNAGLNCLKKMQKIVESDEGRLTKPLIVLTSRDTAIQCVIILPKHYQSIKSARDHPIVYSIDPVGGRRDLLKSTEHRLFEMYLRKGSPENGVQPLFGDSIEASTDETETQKCKQPSESGWWCIYYSLMLINEGADSFLGSKNWASDKIAMIMTVLATHIEVLGRNDIDAEKIVKNEAKLNMSQFRKEDKEIEDLFNIKKSTILEKIELIRSSNVEEQIKKLHSEEQSLEEASDKLRKEIQSIELIIKEGENIMLTRQEGVDTTEAAYRRFITGEEKRLIEARVEKKSEMSRGAILAHNESERCALVQAEIKKLEEEANLEEKKITEKKEKVIALTKSQEDSKDEIKSLENKIKVNASSATTLKAEREKLENEKKKLVTLKSELNQIRIDTDYVALLVRLLKDDVVYDKKSKIGELKTKLEKNESRIDDFNKDIANCDRKVDSYLSDISENRVLISKNKSSISDLKVKRNEADTQVAHFKQKQYEYSGSWRWLGYESDYQKFTKSLDEWTVYRNSLNSSIATNESAIESYEKGIKTAEDNVKKQKEEKSSKEGLLSGEEKDRQQNIDYLKVERNAVLAITDKNIKDFDVKLTTNQTALGANDIDSTSASTKIVRLKADIERTGNELNNINLTLALNQKTFSDLKEKIKKAAESIKVSWSILLEKMHLKN